jgi:Flp pilus assembly protein TadG
MRADRGQATVELALVLPVLLLFLLALVQTALVARDQLLVQDAARAAVREASVGADAGRVRDAARRTLGGVTVEVHRADRVGADVEVTVRYVDHTKLPLVGPLYPDVVLHATATMRAER